MTKTYPETREINHILVSNNFFKAQPHSVNLSQETDVAILPLDKLLK